MRPWFPKKLDRFDDLAVLEPGWIDGSTGERPTAEAIDAGRRLAAVVAMLAEVAPRLSPQITPSAEGGLQLEWHEQGWDAEIAIEPDGKVEVWAWHEDRNIQFSFPPEDE